MNWFNWVEVGFLIGVFAGAGAFRLGQWSAERARKKRAELEELEHLAESSFGLVRKPNETAEELRARLAHIWHGDRASIESIEQAVEARLHDVMPVYLAVDEMKRILAERWLGRAKSEPKARD